MPKARAGVEDTAIVSASAVDSKWNGTLFAKMAGLLLLLLLFYVSQTSFIVVVVVFLLLLFFFYYRSFFTKEL